MKRQQSTLLHVTHEFAPPSAGEGCDEKQPRVKRIHDGYGSRWVHRHSGGDRRDGSEAGREEDERKSDAAAASSEKGMRHARHHYHHRRHRQARECLIKDVHGASKEPSYLNGDGSAANQSRNGNRGKGEVGLDSEFESRSRSSARHKEGADSLKGPSSVTGSERQAMVNNVILKSERNLRGHEAKEPEQKESRRSTNRVVAEAGEGSQREQDEREPDGDDTAPFAQEQEQDGPAKRGTNETSEDIEFGDASGGERLGEGAAMQTLDSGMEQQSLNHNRVGDLEEEMLANSSKSLVEMELDEGENRTAGLTTDTPEEIEAARESLHTHRMLEPSRTCDDEAVKGGREHVLTLTMAVDDDLTQQARKEAGCKPVVATLQDGNELSGDNLMRRIAKDQLREWEKEREKDRQEARKSVKKQRMENGALLSLALPDTSLSLSSGDPHSHQPFPYQHAQSHPSQAPTHTRSTGFTNSISLSHSQPFHHNPSCSLTQTSLDKMEMSSGSQQISQVKEQESCGSWLMSYGSNHANEGFLAPLAQDRQKPKPLYQTLLQSGNNQGSLGSECLRNKGQVQGSDIVGIGQGSPQVALDDSRLQASHSSDARQRHKHQHNDDVRSSPSHSASSRETQPLDLPSHVERTPPQEKGLLEIGAIGSERFTSIQVQDIVSEPILLMACKLQELPDSFLEGLKESLRDMLNSIEKREQFVLLQRTLAARTDLITDTLLRAHRIQLELLVAVKTGILAFLHPEIPMTHSALVEVLLQTKCRNFACQSQLPADECDCKLCAQKTGFCNSCMCVVCSKFDFDANTCRWIGCDFCLHWCHTDCGIRMGYIAPGPSVCGTAGTSEMQFHCIACDHTSELYGFIKDVFCTCAPQWSQDVFTSELDCVRQIFHDSNDAHGQRLCSKAEKMLQQLGAQVDLSFACSTMLKFFSDEDIGRIRSQAPSVSNKVQSQPPPVSNGVVKNPPVSRKGHEVSTKDTLEQARAALQTYDAELEEKRQEAAELQRERERKKGQIEELESIVRIKQAEAKMFAVRADEARREAEGLQHIVLAKAEKIEQEYASKVTKLHLEEAEDRCHKAHDTLQELRKAQLDFHTLKLPLLSELHDLPKQLDATKWQSWK